PRRQRNADAFADLLANKITTELLVLVNAESLPTDHPTPADHPADEDDTNDDGTNDDVADLEGPDGADSPVGMDGAGGSDAPTDDAEDHGANAGHLTDHGEANGANAGHLTDHGSDDAARRPREGSAQASSGTRSRRHEQADTAEAARRLLRWKVPGLLLSTGRLLSPADVERLARTSTLVRLVMDADGQVLDMGRGVRLATKPQRKAVFARYSTCWIDGCPLPATLCQIDHADTWADGGLTNLKLLGPACQHHNRDRYRHPERYLRRREGKDRWAYTYTGPRYRTRHRRATTTGMTTGPPTSGDPL
ncbi:HNH endonuclease signature motif containing protein, partial [Planotetraspora thailandica]